MATSSTRNSHQERAEKVVLHQFGTLQTNTADFPNDWPSGSQFLEMMQSCHEANFANRTRPDAGVSAAQYWQASARWALLSKYQMLPSDLHKKKSRYEMTSDGAVRRLVLSSSDIHAIDQVWTEQCCLTHATSSRDENDLIELLSTRQSNHREMQWTVMDCAPACQFKLHAHPNLELVYCLRGALHEIRMDGAPLTVSTMTDDAADTTGSKSEGKRILTGPNLTDLARSWSFGTLRQGEWLVNEVGSIHKSFTATNGDGCVLLVLWGGSHADIPKDEFPLRMSVQDAVDTMDGKLAACANCTQWDAVTETFLPESEKSHAVT